MDGSMPAVTIERVIPAPPRTVFEAWLDTEALYRFMCPDPGPCVTHVECDPRVGGRFLIVMTVGGKDLPHRGEYLEIERHTKLAFTWLSHVAGEGSRVDIDFAETPEGETRLTLVHTGLPDAAVRAGHHKGWSGILTKLDAWAATERYAD